MAEPRMLGRIFGFGGPSGPGPKITPKMEAGWLRTLTDSNPRAKAILKLLVDYNSGKADFITKKDEAQSALISLKNNPDLKGNKVLQEEIEKALAKLTSTSGLHTPPGGSPLPPLDNAEPADGKPKTEPDPDDDKTVVYERRRKATADIMTRVLKISDLKAEELAKVRDEEAQRLEELLSETTRPEILGNLVVGLEKEVNALTQKAADQAKELAAANATIADQASRLLIDQIEAQTGEIVKRWEEIKNSLASIATKKEVLIRQVERFEQGIVKVGEDKTRVEERRQKELKFVDDFFRDLIAKSATPLDEAKAQAEKWEARKVDANSRADADLERLKNEEKDYQSKKAEADGNLQSLDQETTALQQEKAALIQKRAQLESEMGEWIDRTGKKIDIITVNLKQIEEEKVVESAKAAPKPSAAPTAPPAPAAPTPTAAPAAPAPAAPAAPAEPTPPAATAPVRTPVENFKYLGEWLLGLKEQPEDERERLLASSAVGIKKILDLAKDPELSSIYDRVMAAPGAHLEELFDKIYYQLGDLAGANITEAVALNRVFEPSFIAFNKPEDPKA